MALWGWPDTKSRLGWARRRFRMSLARFRLHHGQRSADADPRSLDVDGSDPPSRHASIGIGEDGDVHPHPPLRCGVAPSQQSFAGRPWSAASRRRTTARANAKGRAARSSRPPLLSARFPVPCPGTVLRALDDAPRFDGRGVVARMNHRRRSGAQPPSRSHAPPRWHVQRSRCAVAVVGVRGGAAPRQPRSGTREAWPQRVCWLSRLSGQIRPPTREVPKADRPPPAAPPTRRATATASRSKRRSCRTQNGRIFLFPVVHECRHSAPSRLAAIRSPIHSSTSASIQPTDRAPSPTGWGKRPSTRHS